MKKKNIIIIVVIVVVVLIGIVSAVILNKNNSNVSEKETTTKEDAVAKNEFVTSDSGEINLEDVSPEVETNKDYVAPGKDTLEIDRIQGFSEKKNNRTEKKNKKDKTKNNEKDNDNKNNQQENSSKYVLSDEQITIESIGAYSGNYLEDGSDEPIENVAAMVITNHSNQMLQVGDITFQVTKKKQAKFRVTNLLPGCSVLVLESNRRKYSDKDDYSYGNIATAYMNSMSLMEDAFEIKSEDGKLTLKNKTNETYKKVYVYYKYSQVGGAYLGGITYRVPFENIVAKTSVESVANHFNKNTSVIVDVQVYEK